MAVAVGESRPVAGCLFTDGGSLPRQAPNNRHLDLPDRGEDWLRAGLCIGRGPDRLGNASIPAVPALAGYQPWNLVLLMVGAPGLLLAFLVFTFAEPARPARPDNAAAAVSGLKSFLGEHRILLARLLGGLALMAICGSSLTAWIPTYLSRQFRLSPVTYGAALGLITCLPRERGC
jgi:hypothetical protein